MKKKAFQALALATLVLGLAVVPVPAASAEVMCSQDDDLRDLTVTASSVAPGPNPIVVGTDTVTMRLDADVESPCFIETGMVVLIAPNDEVANVADLGVHYRSPGHYYLDADVEWHTDLLVDSDAGRWSSLLAVGDQEGPLAVGEGTDFVLQREAKLAKPSAPSKVKKGRTATVSGKLTRVSWDKDAFVAFGKQKVKLQFKSKRGVYENVKTVTSDRRGNLRTTVKAREDGCYRFTFGGTSTTAAATGGADCVDVR